MAISDNPQQEEIMHNQDFDVKDLEAYLDELYPGLDPVSETVNGSRSIVKIGFDKDERNMPTDGYVYKFMYEDSNKLQDRYEDNMADKRFEKEIKATKILQKHGLNVPEILETKELETPYGKVLMIKKPFVGTDLEENFQYNIFSENYYQEKRFLDEWYKEKAKILDNNKLLPDMEKTMTNLGRYIRKVHDIPITEVEADSKIPEFLIKNHKKGRKPIEEIYKDYIYNIPSKKWYESKNKYEKRLDKFQEDKLNHFKKSIKNQDFFHIHNFYNEVIDEEYVDMLENPRELSTILFDTRLANFTENYADEYTINFIDPETLTKGDPMLDLGWLYADIISNKANYIYTNADKLFDSVIKGYFEKEFYESNLEEFFESNSDDELVKELDNKFNRLYRYKNLVFQGMPRESETFAYTMPIDSYEEKCSFYNIDDLINLEDLWIDPEPEVYDIVEFNSYGYHGELGFNFYNPIFDFNESLRVPFYYNKLDNKIQLSKLKYNDSIDESFTDKEIAYFNKLIDNTNDLLESNQIDLKELYEKRRERIRADFGFLYEEPKTIREKLSELYQSISDRFGRNKYDVVYSTGVTMEDFNLQYASVGDSD